MTDEMDTGVGPPALNVLKQSEPPEAGGQHEGSRSGCTLVKVADARPHSSGPTGPMITSNKDTPD